MKKEAAICFTLLVIGVGMFSAFQKCKELYYVHYVGISGNTVHMDDVEPMQVDLPVGYVLLFVDKQEQFGYVYFETREYGRADYVFVLYVEGEKIERRGRFTIWKYFPWQRCTQKDTAVFGDDTEIPYVDWSESGRLIFAFGLIDRVSVAKLADVQNSNFSTNGVKWSKVGVPDY